MPARFMSVAQHRVRASANLLMWAVRSHSGSSAYIKHFHPRSGLRVAGRRSRPCAYSGMERKQKRSLRWFCWFGPRWPVALVV